MRAATCHASSGARPASACELADIVRLYGRAYRNAHRLPRAHSKVLQAIESCRTALLGGHRESCAHCGFERYAYNSCRNRHCPKCKSLAKEQWLEARQAELLPVPYFHNVFTLPHQLNALVLCHEQNQRATAPGLRTILGNCLAHARRQFVDVYDRFPQECGYLLEALAVVYRNDAVARERQLAPQARLEFHQRESQPTMQQVHDWLTRQLEEKLTEPNSALSGAIRYMLRHWEKLTLFLRQAGAPLDNIVCERALKKAILHRKNALFYKTQKGAHVGDLFMSLIYTCQLNEMNPIHYLSQLQEHADELAAHPERWLPWNYQVALA